MLFKNLKINSYEIYKYNQSTLQYEPIPHLSKVLKGLAIFLLLFGFIGATSEKEDNYIITAEDILLVNSQNEFSEDKFISMLDEINLPYPHITLAQAKLETGNFTSKIFNENHNSFGQKEAKVRVNLARGTQYGHAYYNNWEESILDYAFWYSTYASKCKSEEEFYQLLDKVYAEDELYSKKLKNIVEEEQLKDKF
jgi:uncharacterized FlgJ-related protein